MGNKAETCKECKQFRMLCMCPRGGGSDLVEAVRRPGEKSRGPSINAKGTTLHSIAIYAAALKRRSRTKPKPGRPPYLSAASVTSASGAEAAGGLEMTADPGFAARNADEAIIIEADASDELAADDRPITAVGGPELVQVTRPIPASIKRKMMLRLVEAIFTTSEAEEAKPAISEQTADAIKTVRAFDNAQELVAAVPSQRNWKGMAIAILVILSVIGLVALAVVIVTPPDPGPRIAGRRIQLTDILSAKLKPRYFNGTWISGKDMLYMDATGGVTKLDVSSNTTRVFMSNSTFRQLNSHSFSLSSDLQYVLVEYNRKRQFRHSFTAQYSLYNVEKSSHTPLSLTRNEDIADRLQMAQWSPSGHSLAFVHQNDLYYVEAAAEVGQKLKRLTSSGKEGLVYNGVTDWLYEEEILSSSAATWFSKDGSRLLYASFNTSNVGEISFTLYGDSNRYVDPPLYGKFLNLRYPKTGTRNPQVKMTVVDLATSKQVEVKPPAFLDNLDYYFTSVRWLSSDTVSIMWVNRIQNTSLVSKCGPPSYQCYEVYHEKTAKKGWGWVDNRGPPMFSRTGNSMVVIRPVQDSEAGYFPQIVQVDVSERVPSAELPTSLTHGRFEVTRLLGWDEANHKVYYLATLPSDPGVRHLFVVGDASTHHDPETTLPECLTCSGIQNQTEDASWTAVSDGEASEDAVPAEEVNETASWPPRCGYARVKMSKDFKFYVLDCLGPSVPFSSVYSLPENRFVRMLDNNDELKDRLSELAMPKTKQLKFPLPGTDIPARVRLLLPPGFRENEVYTFALIVKVYGGPGTQEVSQRWTFDWDHYLAGNRDFVIATMDVRGSGFSGDTFKHAVYRDLGAVETSDSLHVLKQLLDNVTFLDSTRVAVWGWSYGGYLAARMLAEDENNMLSCAVSVAPVVKWQLYDSAYTERYMDMPGPEGNWKGYENSDLTAKAELFQGKKFFLIHGTADDNVHFQQSMVLTRALVDHNILFRLQVYPDQAHSLSSVRHHQCLAMEDFFLTCFNSIDSPSTSNLVDDPRSIQYYMPTAAESSQISYMSKINEEDVDSFITMLENQNGQLLEKEPS